MYTNLTKLSFIRFSFWKWKFSFIFSIVIAICWTYQHFNGMYGVEKIVPEDQVASDIKVQITI